MEDMFISLPDVIRSIPITCKSVRVRELIKEFHELSSQYGTALKNFELIGSQENNDTMCHAILLIENQMRDIYVRIKRLYPVKEVIE
jgi:hypothetical protein